MKLYAFWAHDRYPGCLGGKVEAFHKDGLVSVASYGPGFLATPLKVLPLEEGLALQKRLNELHDQYWTARDELRRNYARAAIKEAAWLGAETNISDYA
jgi:hypothetical protein